MYHASHLMIETIKRYLSISPNNIFFSSNSLFYFYKNRNLSKCLILSFASWTILPNSLFLLSSSASENLLKIFRLKLFAFIEEFACRKNCFRLQLRFQWRSEEQSGNQVTIFFPRRWCLKMLHFHAKCFPRITELRVIEFSRLLSKFLITTLQQTTRTKLCISVYAHQVVGKQIKQKHNWEACLFSKNKRNIKVLRN